MDVLLWAGGLWLASKLLMRPRAGTGSPDGETGDDDDASAITFGAVLTTTVNAVRDVAEDVKKDYETRTGQIERGVEAELEKTATGRAVKRTTYALKDGLSDAGENLKGAVEDVKDDVEEKLSDADEAVGGVIDDITDAVFGGGGGVTTTVPRRGK